MRPVVTVRPIAAADAPRFREVLDEVARERRYLAFEEAPPIERTVVYVEANIATGNTHLVGLVDDIIVGWCDIVRDVSRPTRRHCGTLGIGILAQYRGLGLGRLLMQQAMAGAAASGLKRIELTVRSSNQRAIALYAQLGFAHEGCQRNAVMAEDGYEDRDLMAYLVPEQPKQAA